MPTAKIRFQPFFMLMTGQTPGFCLVHQGPGEGADRRFWQARAMPAP
jgi:hypothetical protein